MKKYPPIPEERRKKYENIFHNVSSAESMPEDVVSHLVRMQEMGGAGIEMLSDLNKDYLGAFMAPFSRDLENADLAIIGAPFEKSAPMNASQRYGASGLRDLSKRTMGTISDNLDIPFDQCRIIDYGTVDTYGQFDLKDEMQVLCNHLQKIVVENGITPLTWGGDHTISYAPAKACADRHGPLSIIHFDAHFDLVTLADFEYPYTSGTWLSRLFAEGAADPERTIQMGIRGNMTSLCMGGSKSFGTTFYTADEVWDLGAKAMAEKVLEIVGDGPVYISFDADCLDPIYNSSSSAVEPFGLTTRQVYDILRTVRKAGVNLVGADLVEYAPLLDPTKKDGYNLVGLSWRILCWLAAETARRNGEQRQTEWSQAFGYASL